MRKAASHTIYFMNDTLDGVAARCTSTTIGPHVVLTDEHCNFRADGNIGKIVQFDSTKWFWTITGESVDNHDHALLFLDGPSFRDIVPVDALLEAKSTDGLYYYYGSTSGYVSGVLDEGWYDISDVEQDEGLHVFKMSVLRGDSGAAIYGPDGRIIGLVSYYFNDKYSGAFELNFTPEMLRTAHDF